jgi:cobalt-zinc-cadmium efflux system outer membrane protein
MNGCRLLFWLGLLACLGGCQNPLQSPDLKGLQQRYQDLAAPRKMDESATRRAPPPATNSIELVSAAQAEDKLPPRKEPKVILSIPPELPGSGEPNFQMPKLPKNEADVKRYKAELDAYVKKTYPQLPPLEAELAVAPGPEGHPLTLADLQQLAVKYSPAIRAAEAAVDAARGALRQSLAYPNPTFSFQNDTLGTGPAGYPGFAIDQVIKTGNKLQLQGAAAMMDLFNAQVALRRARSDVAYQVRTNYFAVVVALENERLSRAFARFTDEIYKTQINLLKGQQAAAYEPLQLRPLALQARFSLIQAANQYRASWRQLAAALGLSDMPPSEIAGRVDQPVPTYDYEKAREIMLSRHTDVLTAENNIRRAEYALKLAEVMPVPDVEVLALLQKDYTTPPFYVAPSVHVSVALPVWDRNQGGIRQAQGLLAQAQKNLPVARNTLINTLADAFNRYTTAKQQVDIARQQLEDQVRVYKHVYSRFHGGDKAVTFGDVVTAQQALAGYVSGYLTALGLQWTAVVDVANLLQTDDLYLGDPVLAAPDVPLVEHLEALFHCLGSADAGVRLGSPVVEAVGR